MHDATSTHTSLVAHARKSWSPAVAPCLAWTSQFPTHGRPQGPQPRPTPLPPLRETRPLAVFPFGFSLGCCVLGDHKGPPNPSQPPSPLRNARLPTALPGLA